MPYLVELRSPRDVGVREYDRPSRGPGEVAVRTLHSGISAGTEMATYRGTNPYLDKNWEPDRHLFTAGAPTFGYPVDVWGYSEVGVVEAVDDGAGVAVGDVVWGIWGHRSHAVLPAAALTGHVLPRGLDPLVGTFDRVGAVALNAVLASQACPGEVVAVLGQGVIGLLATQLLTATGCTVVAVDAQPHRLEVAGRWAAVTLDARSDDVALAAQQACPEGIDRVIELSGSYPALHQAIRLAGEGGTVVAAGFYQGPATALALGEEFHHNRVTLQASQIGALPPHLQSRWTRERLHRTVVRLCEQGRMDPLPLVTHQVPARDAAAAYALLDQPPADLLQVVLDFTESESA